MRDIKRDIVEEIDKAIGYNLKYREFKSLEDIINNRFSISYPSEIVCSISYNKNKNEFLLDILASYSISISKRAYIDLYYKEKGIEKERRIVYYKDGKRNKEINIKNSDIPPDKYIIPIVQYDEDYILDKNGKIISTNIKEELEYVDVSSFKDVISRIKDILNEYNVQSLNIYDYRVYRVYWRRFKLSGIR